MSQSALIINRVLPIFILIGLGYWMRRSRFVPESTVADLRKIVVNLALPAVLFVSFLNIDMQPAYLVVFVLLFLVCVAMLLLGRMLQRVLRVEQPYFPFMMTGFEYGMLGVSLFGGAYGLENLGYIAVMDLGHELFIWFVFLALLLMKRDGLQRPGEIVGAFFRSPVVIGILAGIILNLLGLRAFLYESAVTGGVMSTLQFLSNLTVPLVLFIVGYGFRLDRQGLREASLVIIARLVVLIPLALVLNRVVIRGLLNLDAPFEAALFTLLILPPPYIVPLFMRADADEDRRYVNNVLTVYTAVSILIFAGYLVLNPTLS